ncbi:MAG TPA: membrane dipeptidase [Aggregatilinea sp.]|uniref:dipeptidase n=1 Tax=Aggregatilinea sp. TaxID=2806333 RepID=UPI002CBCE772|nr:membrane dipeptidase [Aggregatilinea sp.]HML20383.1 membrane dipeptidase [Aggregatilinea sp.]
MTTDIIVDAHQDIAWNAFNNGRDFRMSAWAKRRRETDPTFLKRYGRAMVGLPEVLLGRVAIIGATLFVSPAWTKVYPDEKLLYSTPDDAYSLASRQLDYYQRLADEIPQIDLVRTQADLDAVLATWAEGTDLGDHRVGLVMLMEGADPILEPAQLEEWYARGLRVVGPAWTATRYSGGTQAVGPLTDLGRELLEVMESYGMVLDLSHMAPEAARESLERYGGPLFAGHANPLRFSKDRVDRNLSDDVIRGIAEHDGAVGIMPYNLFLKEGWAPGDRKSLVTMEDILAAIDHVCQVTGSARHVGIGSDFDGGFGAASTPLEFETVADLWEIRRALQQRGYGPEDVTAILGGNMLRVLRAGLPEK